MISSWERNIDFKMFSQEGSEVKFQEDQEGQEAQFHERGYDQVLPALFRRTPGSYQRDYYASANHEDLQGVKDPRGPVGIHATRKRGPRCSQPPLGGLAM
jgi:hypothetical protein